MSDSSLFVFGCAVSFIALAGIYVFLRERFTASLPVTQRVESRADAERRAAAEQRARLHEVA